MKLLKAIQQRAARESEVWGSESLTLRNPLSSEEPTRVPNQLETDALSPAPELGSHGVGA